MSTPPKKPSTSKTIGRQNQGPERASEIGKRLFAPGAAASDPPLDRQDNPDRSSCSTTSSDATKATERCVDYLFLKFSAFYGNNWNNKFTSDEMIEIIRNEWCFRLKTLTSEQFREGWEKCGLNFKTFPPTPVEFYRLVVPNAFYASLEYRTPQLTMIAPDPHVRMTKMMHALEAQTNNPALLRLAKRLKEKLEEPNDGT